MDLKQGNTAACIDCQIKYEDITISGFCSSKVGITSITIIENGKPILFERYDR